MYPTSVPFGARDHRARHAPRRRSSIARVARLALVALAVASCGDDGVAPLPESGPPAAFAVRAAWYGYGSLTVTLSGGALVVVRTPDFDPAEATTFTAVPTDADWAEFWREARTARLERWPRSCVNPQVADGGGISVDIAYEGGRIRSETMNAYPTGDGACVRGGIDGTGEYMVFTAAVGRLIGRPFP